MERNRTEEGFAIIGGTAIMAVGIQCFMEPAKIVAGGVTGIGIILNNYTTMRFGTPTPLWLMNVLCNLPLFFLAWKWEGHRFLGKTLITSLVFSLMLFFAQGFSFYTGDLLLAALYGGALVGVGLGVILKSGATTGGVDLAASLLHRVFRRPTLSGKIFLLDAAIIGAGMVTFGGMNGLYAMLSVFLSERIMLWILQEGEAAKGAIVISHKAGEIIDVLAEKLGRDMGEFLGKGEKKNEETQILFCIFSQKEIQAAKSIIINIDENAEFYLMELREVTTGERKAQ